MKKQIKKITKFIPLVSLIFFSPIVAFAQFMLYTPSVTATDPCSTLGGISNLICKAHGILNLAVPFLIALGVVYFIWGVVQYVIGNDEEAKKRGKNRIIYGIIGLAIIIGLWGIVNIVVTTFGLGGQTVSINDLVTPLQSTNQAALCRFVSGSNLQQLLMYVTCIISSSVIPLIFTLAVAMFVWGVVQYVINSNEEAKKEKGKQFMIWGIIALTVMISVWGLVGILGKTFGINTSLIPQVKVP